jgi:capsid protein
LNVSYVSLANDLEGVSYSSIRQGELADRDHWKRLQGWLIEHFCTDVFENWLVQFLSFGRSGFLLAEIDRYNCPVWRPRGWQWVDPDKESKAAERDIGNHTKSIWDAAADRGDDLEDVFSENARAIELAKEYGLHLSIFDLKKEGKDNAETDSGSDTGTD